MYAATATKKVACNMLTLFILNATPESYTDMNTEPAEHCYSMFCNLGKGRDKT